MRIDVRPPERGFSLVIISRPSEVSINIFRRCHIIPAPLDALKQVARTIFIPRLFYVWADVSLPQMSCEYCYGRVTNRRSKERQRTVV